MLGNPELSITFKPHHDVNMVSHWWESGQGS